MFPDYFLLAKIAMSFCIGGGVVALVTYLAEVLGPRFGGILAGFPSIILVSLLFFALVLGVEQAQKASLSTLVSLSLFGVFCSAYVHLVRFGFVKAIAGALAAWLLAAVPVILLHIQSPMSAFLLYVVISAVSYSIMNKKVSSAGVQVRIKKSAFVYLVRFLAGGSAIALAAYFKRVHRGNGRRCFCCFSRGGHDHADYLKPQHRTGCKRAFYQRAICRCGVKLWVLYSGSVLPLSANWDRGGDACCPMCISGDNVCAMLEK